MLTMVYALRHRNKILLLQKKKTAQGWVAEDKKDPQGIIMRQAGSDRPVGRPPILTEEHRKFMANWADENAESVTLNDMMEVLTNKFGKIEISKTALYNFVREKCRITWKKAHFESVDRNCTEKLDERYDWVKKWIESDLLDYESNCIFIDKASFHINSKRNFSWSRKGARARVKIPKTRAPTHTILGAICAHGVVNICIKRPSWFFPIKYLTSRSTQSRSDHRHQSLLLN